MTTAPGSPRVGTPTTEAPRTDAPRTDAPPTDALPTDALPTDAPRTEGGGAALVDPHLIAPHTEDLGRVDATDAALAELRALWREHGPLVLSQGGGCCDGSAPICLVASDLPISRTDVLVAVLDAGVLDDGTPVRVPFWQSDHQHTYTRHLHLTLDVRPGGGAEFSLETLHDLAFVIDSRLE